MSKPGLGLTNKLWAVHIDGQVPTVIEDIVAATPEAAVSKALHKVLTLLKMEAEPMAEGKKNEQV